MTDLRLKVRKAKKRKILKQEVAGDDEDDFDLQLEDKDESVPVSSVPSTGRTARKGGAERYAVELEKPPKLKKRKKSVDARTEQTAAPATTAETPADILQEAKRLQAERAAAKALKRKQSRLQRKAKRLSAAVFEQTRVAARNIAFAPLEQQAEWLWNSFKESTKAAQVERTGLYESTMATLGGAGRLEDRLGSLHKGWRQELASAEGVKEGGSPMVVFICASAVSANNLTKRFRNFGRGCRVSKLFARHFKVEEQQKDLQRVVNVATGTPNRMDKLADLGSLKFDRLQLVVLDVALDAKQMTILDIPDTRIDFWLFFKKHLRQHLAAGKAKLALLDSSNCN